MSAGVGDVGNLARKTAAAHRLMGIHASPTKRAIIIGPRTGCVCSGSNLGRPTGKWRDMERTFIDADQLTDDHRTVWWRNVSPESGAERHNFPLIAQLHLGKSRSRSVPAPTTSRSRSAHAPLDFLNPAHRSAPLNSVFSPLRSVFRSADAPLTCSAEKGQSQ